MDTLLTYFPGLRFFHSILKVKLTLSQIINHHTIPVIVKSMYRKL